MTLDSFLQPKRRKVSDDQEHYDALVESSASIHQDDHPDLDTNSTQDSDDDNEVDHGDSADDGSDIPANDPGTTNLSPGSR